MKMPEESNFEISIKNNQNLNLKRELFLLEDDEDETGKTQIRCSLNAKRKRETSYSNETINNIIQADPVIDYKMVIEQKLKTIEELNNKISLEIAKIIICEPCRRKFANKSHYIRHVTLSEIHKNKI